MHKVTLVHYGGVLRKEVEVIGFERVRVLRVVWGELSGVYRLDLKSTKKFPYGILRGTRGLWKPLDLESCLQVYFLLERKESGIKRVVPYWTALRK